MKKVLAMILAVLMFASLATTAFAETTMKEEKDLLKTFVNADTKALKDVVKQVNAAAEAAKVDNDAAIKQWKSDMLDVAKGQKAVIEEIANLNGVILLDSAYLNFVYNAEIPMIKGIKGYTGWLFDVDSANSLAKTVAATQKELNDILDAGQKGVEADVAALEVAWADYDTWATNSFAAAGEAWAAAWD